MKIAVVIATRPDVIKLAPVVHALRRLRPRVQTRVVATSQHQQLVEPLLKLFDLKIAHDLHVMKPGQSLDHIVSAVVDRFGAVLDQEQPDLLLVQGDTTSAMAATLAAFHRQVPIGHVEAGLRTGDMRNPFPEEANRKLISALATWHYAPTASARENLRRERIADDRILVTGNTVVDALHLVIARTKPPKDLDLPDGRVVVVTCHRRENHGQPLERVCAAIRLLADAYPDVAWVIPLHPNPKAGGAIRHALHGVPTVRMTPPLEYPAFIWLLSRCYCVLSDSGGVQEEAPALGKPVIVLREATERTEAVRCGAAMLTGTCTDRIVAAMRRLLTSPQTYKKMAQARNIFGDGHAAQRIAAHIQQHGV